MSITIETLQRQWQTLRLIPRHPRKITGGDLTLAGGPTDVWIFQIASDLQVGVSAKVILTGGALPRNIFWQVGTSAVIETFAVFKGIILAEHMPAAIAALESATASEVDVWDVVTLRQHARPFIEMLQSCHQAGDYIVWGV